MSQEARGYFAVNLARLLERAGCSQADLTRELGLRQSTVSDWMSGKKYPRIENLQLLADFFGVRQGELVEDAGALPPPPGSLSWLRDGLFALGLPAERFSQEQLKVILQSVEMLARAACRSVDSSPAGDTPPEPPEKEF